MVRTLATTLNKAVEVRVLGSRAKPVVMFRSVWVRVGGGAGHVERTRLVGARRGQAGRFRLSHDMNISALTRCQLLESKSEGCGERWGNVQSKNIRNARQFDLVNTSLALDEQADGFHVCILPAETAIVLGLSSSKWGLRLLFDRRRDLLAGRRMGSEKTDAEEQCVCRVTVECLEFIVQLLYSLNCVVEAEDFDFV